MAFLPILDVYLHGSKIGMISRQGSTVAFEFSDDYLRDPKRATLGLHFEENLGRTSYATNRLPNWFGHLLPEGQLGSLLDASLGLNARTMSRLEREVEIFEAIGKDLPGGVQVIQAAESTPRQTLRSAPPQDIESDSGRMNALLRFSVAGVGLKMSMVHSNHRFTAPATDERGNWLVKMPDRMFPDLPLNEFATMSAARACGIDVPEIRLVRRDEIVGTPDSIWSGEQVAFAIRRFDRPGGGLVHIEDLAQVRDLAPGERKYSGNFETVASLAYRGSDERALEEVVRRIAFSLLIGNSDAHLKNWSLIYPDGRIPTLSPAYDLVSVVVYADLGIDTSLALRLANRRRYETVEPDNLERLMRKVGGRLLVAEIVSDVIDRCVAFLPEMASMLSERPAVYAAIEGHVKSMIPRLR